MNPYVRSVNSGERGWAPATDILCPPAACLLCPLSRARCMLMGMLQPNELTFADEIACQLRRMAADDPDQPMSVWALATKLVGARPRQKVMANAGELVPLEDRFLIYTREGLPVADKPVVIGHELCHFWFERTGERPPCFVEALCDAVGARLATPEKQFRAAILLCGHRVHALAKMFNTTQAVALLRIAELTGRPGMVKRSASWISRGADFEWADDWRAIPRAQAHYVRVDDRWGMLAA